MHVSINQSIQSLTEKHPLTPYWQNLLAPIQAQALSIALKVKLFDHLTEFTTIQQIVPVFEWHTENAAYFLQLLASMQLLDVYEEIHNSQIYYRNKPLSKRYFTSSNPDYCGDAFLFRHTVTQHVATQIEDMLTKDFTPQKPSEENIAQAWANAARLQIAQEQSTVSIHIADKISALIGEFERAERFLDIGAGAGLISLHFSRKYPQLQCSILELPDVIEVIKSQCLQEPSSINQRIEFIAGDIQDMALEQRYDLIWCSSVLHFVEDYQSILAKMYTALKSGGVLICAHSEIDPRHDDPYMQSYYFNMRVQGNFVPAKGEIAAALNKIGCSNIQYIEHVQFPVAPLNVIIARK